MRVIYFFLLGIIVIGLTACGSNRSNVLHDTDIADAGFVHEYTAVLDTPTICETDITPAPIASEPPTITDFIRDLDYLLYVLQNNFANFDVAYIERGVDITVLIHELQSLLLTKESIAFSEFYYMLTTVFRPLFNIAHFHIFQPHPNHPHLIPDIANENEYQPARTAQDYFDIFTTAHLPLLQHMFVSISMYYGEEKADEKWNAIQDGCIDIFVSVIKSYNNMPNIFTRIIDEDKVAYMAMRTMMPARNTTTTWHETTTALRDFYYEIREYDHLIIDLRGNLGGSLGIFRDIVLNPLTPDGKSFTLETYFFTFLGEYAQRFLSSPLCNRSLALAQHTFLIDQELRPIADILEESCLPELNMANIQRMDYGFRVEYRYNLWAHPRFRDVYFRGNIWLLIDEYTGSAGHEAAWISKESGFATLVGVPTGGNYGGTGVRATATLPNSRIMFQFDPFNVLDSRGRAMEAGILPHHFNRPGMGALATTLALITEGQY